MPAPLAEHAPAKVNLTLRVLRRRSDGYHEIESLVAFADFGDRLTVAPGSKLTLNVRGADAAETGQGGDNLVLKAARALAARVSGVILGAFDLEKNLPVAAGLGGGSADAAAALRLLARANDLALGDARLYEAARATGADVPVCIEPRPRIMGGIGEILSAPLSLPPLPALLVNPGVRLATKVVFAAFKPAAAQPIGADIGAAAEVTDYGQFLQLLGKYGNDLETAAIALQPVIAEVISALRELPGCKVARMSGSGASCFGLFDAMAAAREAAEILSGKFPQWWIRPTTLGHGCSSYRRS